MPHLRFILDINKLSQELKGLSNSVKEDLVRAVGQVSSMTYAKTQELANSRLSSLRELYTQNLEYRQITSNIWVVSLNEPALWIEEGRQGGSMVSSLLKKKAKIAKDGSRYRAIPFKYNKKSSSMPRAVLDLVRLIKSTLRANRIPFTKIEVDSEGKPKIGKLHTLNINSPFMSPRASMPALYGLTIYQRLTENNKVSRDILTFRTVSSKHEGIKWIHPGFPAKKFMDQALDWASKVFEQEILPTILEKYGK